MRMADGSWLIKIKWWANYFLQQHTHFSLTESTMSISDNNSFTASPRSISLSLSKLDKFKDQLSPMDKLVAKFKYSPDKLDNYLKTGDSQAAVVLQTYNTLIVAAYSSELDSVALLQFSVSIAKHYDLAVGDRLLTINSYPQGKKKAPDLQLGANSTTRYHNVYPLIADFLSEDDAVIESIKRQIKDTDWKKALKMGHAKMMQKGVIPRNGSPYSSHIGIKNKP